ncbi:hypothetical protein INS49_015480 [Diaporthe citri]|uniref:uncharacterized protein n=1 Tax=Diaporthe citri TaxID=83186 RepID=UPI001C7E3E85|nr:uncharacterized protein INS49_015480 [Diaporthe citri]KAG6356095.1 hypothetical protein INS49_015480 [Diaporthe citri]
MAYTWVTSPPAIVGFVLSHVAREAALDHTLARYAAVNRDWRLCSKLPELEELCLQDVHYHNEHTKHLQIAELTPRLPTNLRRLHVLGQGGRDPKGVCRFLVQRLVWFGVTTRLQELSITTSGNAAEEFFECLRNLVPGSSARGTCHWSALQFLTLTCSLLEPGAAHAAVNRLLHQAGMTALGLPRLRELRLLSYNIMEWGELDGFLRYVAKGQEKDVTTYFASEHIRMGRLVTDTWRNVAWESHRSVLRLSSSATPPSPSLAVEGLFGEHGGSAFENTQYPRPHWTASEVMWNLLGAFVFFVALVSLLSLLVTQIPSKV